MHKIREYRIEKGLTQNELASKIGVIGHNVGDWERGKCEPSLDMLVKLSDALDISIDCLLGKNDDFARIAIPGQSTDQLTTDERELLSCFNATDFAGREALLISARALAGKKEKSKQKV